VEAQLLREMAGALAAVTRHGALYESDFRLRPYGASGSPVQSLQALRDYFAGPAQLWERLSYLKARPVAGSGGLCREALDAVWGASLPRGSTPQETEGLMGLRLRLESGSSDFESALKFRPGGLLHQDLLVLSLQLRAGLVPAAGGFGEILARLESDGILSSEHRGTLYRARSFMEGFLHRSRIRFARSPRQGWPKNLLAELDTLWLPRLSGDFGAPSAGTLERAWTGHGEAVVGIWERVIARG
jgi:glutamine synthetase adenylyltransferase